SMKSRLFFAALCILVLPMIVSNFQNQKLANSAPFATSALAGHLASGGWCQCGCPGGCICDPNEVPFSCGGDRMSTSPDSTADGTKSDPSNTDNTDGSLDLELGSAALVFGIVLMWTRFNA